MKFLEAFIQSCLKCFSWRSFLWYAGAAGATLVLVVTSFDWKYFLWVQHSFFYPYLFPAVAVGFFVPLLLPIILVVFAFLDSSLKVLKTAFVLAYAEIMGYLVSILFKALSGRVPPPHIFSDSVISTLSDMSRQFQFGFLRGGVFWGWPSSHTTVAFAMAFVLIEMYPKSKILKYFMILYAVYIGIGVSTGIHWFSEVLAGAIFGMVVGRAVGKSFSKI